MNFRKALNLIARLDQLHWRVLYVGQPFAPNTETYQGVDPVKLSFATKADTGVDLERGNRTVRQLQPLMAAALFEVGFAAEAGPLTTWSN